MKLQPYFKRLIAYFSFAFITLISANSQQNNTLYFLNGIPQSSEMNPATPLKCGFYIGFPALSSIEVNAGNSALGFNDVLSYKKEIDSLVWFLYDESTQKNFLNKFKSDDKVFADLRWDLFSMGFRINKTYLSFNVGERVNSNFKIPYGLPDLFVNGNIAGIDQNAAAKTFDLSGLGANLNWYTEVSVGINHEFNNKLTIGIRPKVLFGVANVSTGDSRMYLKETGIKHWIVENHIKVNTSIPFMKIGAVPDNGSFSTDSIKMESSTAQEKISTLKNTQNLGLGIDLGVYYKLNSKVNLSASIIDLGYIRWKSNLNQLNIDNNYTFEGVGIDFDNVTNLSSGLKDTVKNMFKFSTGHSAYTTYLSPKLYLAANFQLNKVFGLGALTRLELSDNQIKPQYTASILFTPFNCFNLAFSYTIAEKVYDNFGFGFMFKPGPIQYYLMCERIPSTYYKAGNYLYVPMYFKNFNIHTGVNFVFGYNRMKKLLKDKPLVEE